MNTPQLGPRDVEIEDVVIVTGGMGFIGSLVADAFLARGRRVVIIDSLVSSVIPTEPREAEPNCTVLKMSVDDDFLDGGSLAGAERVIAERVKQMTDPTSEVIYADAKTIRGKLHEEAESFEKTPVLGAAPAVGSKPSVGLEDLIRETIDYSRPIVAGKAS